jgi:hypothetical protein
MLMESHTLVIFCTWTLCLYNYNLVSYILRKGCTVVVLWIQEVLDLWIIQYDVAKRNHSEHSATQPLLLWV